MKKVQFAKILRKCLGNKYMAKLEIALYQYNLKTAPVMPNPNEGKYLECNYF